MSKYNKHFKGIITREVKNYATNHVLGDSKYIFVTREGKQKIGYCTHCNKSFEMPDEWKHNKLMTCKKCKSTCQVKDTRYSHTRLVDCALFFTFSKSKADSNAIVGTMCYTERDYRRGYKNIQTYISECQRYYYSKDGAIQFEKSWGNSWYRSAKLSGYTGGWTNIRIVYNKKSLSDAVQGTFCEHMYNDCCEDNAIDQMQELALFCKYQYIEFLLKGPFKKLVKDYMDGQSNLHTFNWKAKTPYGFFKLSKQGYEKVKNNIVSFGHLKAAQMLDAGSNRWAMDDVDNIYDAFDMRRDITTKGLKEIVQHLSPVQISNYINKQMQKKFWCHNGQGEAPVYSDETDITNDWMDYILDCKLLEYDLSDSLINRPKDLQSAHENTLTLALQKRDKQFDNKVKARSEKLNDIYTYENDRYIVYPADSASEIIREGNRLRHCVAKYIGRYVKNQTIILFVREKHRPSKSFYTMEINPTYNDISQCRTYKNVSYTQNPELKAFVDEYRKEFKRKLKESKNKRRKAS